MPTPMTPRRDIRSDSWSARTRAAALAATSGSSCMNSPSGVMEKPIDWAVAVGVPTNETLRPSAVLTRLSTTPMGLPMVELLLPANRSATGCLLLSFVTMSEPESPPALNVVLLMTTWLGKVRTVPPPEPQLFG
jgi:hypothetical protein